MAGFYGYMDSNQVLLGDEGHRFFACGLAVLRSPYGWFVELLAALDAHGQTEFHR